MKTVAIERWKRHPGLVHGYSTKELGNLSVRLGDTPEVWGRRGQFAEAFGIDWNDAFFLPITHSNRVLSLPNGSALVKDKSGQYVSGGHVFTNKKPAVYHDPERQSGIDAVVTDMKGEFPVVLPADCACVGLFDATKSVVALAHVGLVGAVNDLAGNTIRCMVDEYGCDPKDIEAVIFPSIRSCHYDLSKSGLPEEAKSVIPNSGRIDLQSHIMRQLENAGIPGSSIVDTGLCTICNRDLFFSNYAAGDAEGKRREGRFGVILGMRKE